MKIDAATIVSWLIILIPSSLIALVLYGAVSGAMMTSRDFDACTKAGGYPLNTRDGVACVRKDALIE